MFDIHQSPYQPLPGTTRAPRALFVKRWGTLLRIPERGYAEHASEVRFFDGALDALFRADRRGWKIYLIGNEEAVYTGRLAKAAWDEVEAEIQASLQRAGIRISRTYACLEHPEGVKGHQGDSVYLLPNTGAFYHALHHDGIDLQKSWVVGDSNQELVAGWRAGIRHAGVRSGLGLADVEYHVDPDFVAEDLQQAVMTLLTAEEALHP